MIRRSHRISVALLCSLAAAHAQDKTPPPTTNITAIVRDSHNNLVPTLTQNDLIVKEDGVPQKILSFTEALDLPFQIGLVIDTTNTQTTFFPEQSTATITFLHNLLTRPEDSAFLVRYDANILLLQRPTSNIPRLETALGELSKPFPLPEGANPTATTRLYDALRATAQQLANKDPTRRAIILLTSGEDIGSKSSLDEAIQRAQDANTPVYIALYASQPSAAMQRLALATGGSLFTVSPQTPIDHIYQQIAADLQAQYRFTYTPPPAKPGTHHTLEVKSRDKALSVQTRSGYDTPQTLSTQP